VKKLCHQKVRELEIVIDEARRDKQISEITDTDYFRRIQQKVEALRARRIGGKFGGIFSGGTESKSGAVFILRFSDEQLKIKN